MKKITPKTLMFRRAFEPLIKKGGKTCTSRAEAKGEVDEIMTTPLGTYIRILGLCTLPLSYVAESLYGPEGCQSPDQFIEVWLGLHRGHYKERNLVVVHFFEVVPEKQLPENIERSTGKARRPPRGRATGPRL